MSGNRSGIEAVVGAALLAFFLVGCAGSGGGAGSPGPGSGSMRPDELEPTVHSVPGVDLHMLWKASRGYLKRLFPLELVDEQKRVAETGTLEWKDGRFAYRTRITVQVAPDPRHPNDGRLGVIAQIQQPAWMVRDGTPSEREEWLLTGSHPEMERFVIDRILERYLLLRQGRDPDLLPPSDPREARDG